MTDWKLNIGLTLALLFAIALAGLIGETSMNADQFFRALFGIGGEAEKIVLWEIRMPRAISAAFVGIALGLSGAALQGLLRNPLAEPGVLGVSATSALAASTALFYGLAASPLVLALFSITGAIIATAFLLVAAIFSRSVVSLILIGVGLSSFAGAMMALMLNLSSSPFSLTDLINWSLGSVANRSFHDLVVPLPFFIAGAGLLFVSANGLRALTLGEESARAIGVDVKRQRIAIVIATGLMTGSAVAIAGAIGFVGIVAPHLMRPFVGHDPARALIPAGLAAGIILVLADIAVRLIPTTTELKLGVVAALIGAPAFIWIAVQRRGVNG